MTAGYHALREKLLGEGVLVEHGPDQIRLVRTYAFDSPSSAASVLSGGSKNGRTEWRDGQGRTLRENPQDTADAPTDEPPANNPREIEQIITGDSLLPG